jgi:hemerythrin-like domain-containing protein
VSLFRIGKSPSPPPSFDDPVAFLTACHRRLLERLTALERAAAVPGAALDVLAEFVRHFDGAGVRHTDDEEASVFPRLAGAGLGELLAALEAEHRAAEAVYLAARTCVNRLLAAPELAAAIGPELAVHAAALAAMYREHIRREEAELFPAISALPPAELRAIGIEMRLRRGGEVSDLPTGPSS